MWKPIEGFEDLYLINEEGQILGLKRNKILNWRKEKTGYYTVRLYKEGKGYNKFVHRLVAETFIPNIENKPQVNHKDENKANNNVSNLEWVTIQENARWGTRTERIVKASQKQIAMCDKNTHQIIKIYNSITEASKDINTSISNISQVANGKGKTAGGYYWQFIFEDFSERD